MLDKKKIKEKLEKEQEVVGFYLTAHPLQTYEKQLAMLSVPQFLTLRSEVMKCVLKSSAVRTAVVMRLSSPVGTV